MIVLETQSSLMFSSHPQKKKEESGFQKRFTAGSQDKPSLVPMTGRRAAGPRQARPRAHTAPGPRSVPGGGHSTRGPRTQRTQPQIGEQTRSPQKSWESRVHMTRDPHGGEGPVRWAQGLHQGTPGAASRNQDRTTIATFPAPTGEAGASVTHEVIRTRCVPQYRGKTW